jgi:hypothetical protein
MLLSELILESRYHYESKENDTFLCVTARKEHALQCMLPNGTCDGYWLSFRAGDHMKKQIVIAALVFAVSVASSFGTGRIEITTHRPMYDQNRDQQWLQMQRNQEWQQQRERDRWLREEWQRDRWQREQAQRTQRHERYQNYEFWLSLHMNDYDRRG